MPTKLIRTQLLNRGFGGEGKRAEIAGRLCRVLRQEAEEFEKLKTAEEKRDEELAKMQQRVQKEKEAEQRKLKVEEQHKQIAAEVVAKSTTPTNASARASATAPRFKHGSRFQRPGPGHFRKSSVTKAPIAKQQKAAVASPTGRKLAFGGNVAAPKAAADPAEVARTKQLAKKGLPEWWYDAEKEVKIKSLSPGDGVSRPRTGDLVLFHYKAVIASDSTEIDSSYVWLHATDVVVVTISHHQCLRLHYCNSAPVISSNWNLIASRDNRFKRNAPERFVVGSGEVLKSWEYAITKVGFCGKQFYLLLPYRYSAMAI